MVFADYAKYYNLIYRDKDYKKESQYIDSLIKKYCGDSVDDILELGCGTGIHASFLSEYGYNISGMDLSEEMVKIAKGIKNSNLEFYCGDARSFKLDKSFKTVISIFHVASYQNSNKDFSDYVKNASVHLETGGVFIFDFWYGPAVLTDLPVVRIKRLEDEYLKITRIAEPVLKENLNIVEVNYEVIIEDKKTSDSYKLNEIHPMRYYFLPEINMFLESQGFELIDSFDWLSEEKPSLSSWNVVCIGRKK